MIKNLTPIGNSEGLILDKTLLGLLGLERGAVQCRSNARAREARGHAQSSWPAGMNDILFLTLEEVARLLIQRRCLPLLPLLPWPRFWTWTYLRCPGL